MTDRFYKLCPGEQKRSYVFVCFVDLKYDAEDLHLPKNRITAPGWPPCSTVSRKPSGGPVRWSGSPRRRGCETQPVERHCLPVRRATKVSWRWATAAAAASRSSSVATSECSLLFFFSLFFSGMRKCLCEAASLREGSHGREGLMGMRVGREVMTNIC